MNPNQVLLFYVKFIGKRDVKRVQMFTICISINNYITNNKYLFNNRWKIVAANFQILQNLLNWCANIADIRYVIYLIKIN